MKKGQHSSAMVELIIAIGVLALVSTFVIRLFVQASNLALRSQDMDIAVNKAQSLMEIYKAERKISQPQYYDADWNSVEKEDAKGFTLTMEPKQVEGKNKLLISIRRNNPYPLADNQGPVDLFTLTGAYFGGAE